MYNLTFSQNDHFNQKNNVFFKPMPLIKINILLINANILVKLNFLKSYDFLLCHELNYILKKLQFDQQ